MFADQTVIAGIIAVVSSIGVVAGVLIAIVHDVRAARRTRSYSA